MDEYGDLAEFDSSPLSLINFSFKVRVASLLTDVSVLYLGTKYNLQVTN